MTTRLDRIKKIAEEREIRMERFCSTDGLFQSCVCIVIKISHAVF